MFFLDEAGLDAKEALLKHVVSCQECSLKFDVLRRLHHDLKTRVGAFDKEASPSQAAVLVDKITAARHEKGQKQKTNWFFSLFLQRSTAALALAASLVIIIAVTGVLLILKSPPAELVRGETGQKLTLIEPLGKIGTPPLYFRWTDLRDKDYYRFKLIDSSLDILAEGRVLHKNLYALPPLIRDQLKKKTTYIWSVEAVDDNNQILDVKSGHFSIE